MSGPTVGILLAAGRSRRFGAEDKLLAPLDGRPLVSHAAAALAASGAAPLAAVVSSPAVAALLPGFELLRLAPDLPMSRSFAAALDHARRLGAARMLICLGDMPGVTEGLLARLLAQPGSAACRFAGRRLPPACIAAGDFPAALALPEGDHGARALIAGVPEARLIALSAAEARDVDRPGDLAGP